MHSHLQPQLLFLGGLVVQATFTFTLALLAWSDRRTRGMVWLALAGVLTFVAMSYRMVRGLGDNAPWDIPGSALMLVILACMYMGLRWFTVRAELRSRRWPLIVGVTTVLALLVRHQVPHLSQAMLRLPALVMVYVTMLMLWRTKFASLRPIARATACVFALLTFILAARGVMVVETGYNYDGGIPIILYGRAAVLIAVTFLQFCFVALFVAESKRRLHVESRLDSLTGLHNRRSIEEAAVHAVREATEKAQPLSLLMLDLDHFKALNDTWGHGVGDLALTAVGAVLSNVVDGGDCVARLGGEEFAVLLSDTDMKQAGDLAERLRKDIAALRLLQDGETVTLTTSIGVSVLREGERDWSMLLHRADVALYQAKREGRNRVVLCTSELEESSDALGGMPRTERRDWRRALLGRGPLL